MENEIKLPSTGGWKSILCRVSTSLALFGVIIAIMFVFLIGFGINDVAMLGLASSVSDVNLNDNVWIYDYFGKIYKQIAETTEGVSDNGSWDMYNFVEPSLYIPAILCTVIAAGAIVSVVTLGIISILKLVRKLMGKEEADAEKFAFATILTYLLGAAALRVFNNASVQAFYISNSSATGITSLNVNVEFTYNAATIVGIVLCAVALGASLACRIATRDDELKDCKTLSNGIFTIVSIVLAGVIVHLASCASLTVAGSQSGVQLYLAMPMSSMLQMYAASLGWVQEPFDDVFFVFSLMMFLQLVVLALAFTSLITQINNVLANKEDSALMLNITLTVACVVSLVLSIVCISVPLQGEENTINATFAPSIAALILAVLSLCTSVARKLISRQIDINHDFD